MSEGLPVKCGRHGEQPRTWLCSHSRQSLKDGRLRGFYWSDDGRTGWCSACEELRLSRGGEIDTRMERAMGMTLTCGGCFEDAKRINGFD